MEGGELFHQIVKLTYFSENLSRHVILQVANGIRYLHEERGVVHRDIKPENFIVTDGFVEVDGRRERKVLVKLSDFGLSTTDVESGDMDCGSAPYMSYGK